MKRSIAAIAVACALTLACIGIVGSFTASHAQEEPAPKPQPKPESPE